MTGRGEALRRGQGAQTQETARGRTDGAVARRRREVRAMVVDGRAQTVLVQADESPLGWLARRKGRDGRPLISPTQFAAGERLRLDFTRASLTPRVTSDWSALGAAQGGSPGSFSDVVLAAKARVAGAVRAVGPELSGVVLDVCCFLKGLESVEGERGWPARTAKVVLCLGLDRLAAHYGLAGEAVGCGSVAVRAWRASDPPGDGRGRGGAAVLDCGARARSGCHRRNMY